MAMLCFFRDNKGISTILPNSLQLKHGDDYGNSSTDDNSEKTFGTVSCFPFAFKTCFNWYAHLSFELWLFQWSFGLLCLSKLHGKIGKHYWQHKKEQMGSVRSKQYSEIENWKEKKNKCLQKQIRKHAEETARRESVTIILYSIQQTKFLAKCGKKREYVHWNSIGWFVALLFTWLSIYMHLIFFQEKSLKFLFSFFW